MRAQYSVPVQSWADPMDCSLPGSSIHGILQARILEWVAISFSRRSSPPRDRTCISCIGRLILYHLATWEALQYCSRLLILIAAAPSAKSLQSCPTLCGPIDGSPPGSSVPGILQERILEWVAISFSSACMHACMQSCFSRVRLCDAMDSSPPSSSVHSIL